MFANRFRIERGIGTTDDHGFTKLSKFISYFQETTYLIHLPCESNKIGIHVPIDGFHVLLANCDVPILRCQGGNSHRCQISNSMCRIIAPIFKRFSPEVSSITGARVNDIKKLGILGVVSITLFSKCLLRY